MKKLFLVFAVLFVSCFEVQVKPREVNAQTIPVGLVNYAYYVETIDNMKYGIWVADGGAIRSSAIFIVNHTKDALEVELLKKQLKK